MPNNRVFYVLFSFGDRQCHHGQEIPPGLLPPEVVDYHVDGKELMEFDSSERGSVYRLLREFSSCAEREQLTPEELSAYGLPV